jgi:hypothetical protein
VSGLCALVAACSPAPAPTPVPEPDPVRTAVVATIDAINATADAGVAAQRAALTAAVHPDSVEAQRECRPATITVRIDAVVSELRADPDWRDPAAPEIAPRGSVYRVPARLAVFTEGRRTGTDLTLLHVAVLDGRAHTFPLCLS